MVACGIFQSIVGRFILLCHGIMIIAFTAVALRNNLYLLFGFLCLPQLIEAIYVVCKRQGKEYTWISLSTVCYLAVAVPPLWNVELHVLTEFNTNRSYTGSTNSSSFPHNSLERFGIKFSDELAMQILKQTLLLVVMLHRWVIPRGNLTRNGLSHLLFVFFALASDIMELFDLFDEEKVKTISILSYVILAVWTLSLTQLCMVLTNTRLSRRARPTSMEAEEKTPDDIEGQSCCHSVVATDIWGILITLFTMDVPFLVVRVYIMAALNIFSYGIIFFTAKNILVILLSMYRFIIICRRDVVEV